VDDGDSEPESEDEAVEDFDAEPEKLPDVSATAETAKPTVAVTVRPAIPRIPAVRGVRIRERKGGHSVPASTASWSCFPADICPDY